MARPSVTHDGFLIPNAADVSNPRMAEPDRIDFNTLSNQRFGVITGCLITVSGTTASTTGGVGVVAGQRVAVASQSVTLSVGGSLDRFDAICIDAAGTLKIQTGATSNDPVFPDVLATYTLLAMVFAPAGTSNFADLVVDKRTMLATALQGNQGDTDPLVENTPAGGTTKFLLRGDGRLQWRQNLVNLYASSDTDLRTDDTFIANVLTSLTTIAAAGNITAGGTITGVNLVLGTSLPGSGNSGDLFVDTAGGRLYIRKAGTWQEIATLAGAVPVGCVMDSIEPPSVMVPLGWVPLDGRTVTESQYPSLFNLTSLSGYITGVAPNRSMVLPQTEGRYKRSTWSGAGQVGGPVGNQLVLTEANMPLHKHDVDVIPNTIGPITISMGRAGTHNHPVDGGEHGHPVTDPGHQHRAMEAPNGGVGDVISLFWGGRNKIDALFNDRNHTYSVEPLQFTVPAFTGLTIGSSGSAHGHALGDAGDHDHPISASAAAPHDHTVTETTRGSGSPINVGPSYLSVYTYVRS